MTKEKTVQSETLDLDFVSFRLATTFYGLRWFKSLGKLTSGFDFFFFFSPSQSTTMMACHYWA
jgi:hypothetical protein